MTPHEAEHAENTIRELARRQHRKWRVMHVLVWAGVLAWCVGVWIMVAWTIAQWSGL